MLNTIPAATALPRPPALTTVLFEAVDTSQREIADAAQLAGPLAPFAELTDCLLRQLRADEAASPPPTPLQLMMGRLTR